LPADHLEVVLEAVDPVVALDGERVVLLLSVAQACGEDEAAAAEDVEGRQRLRHGDRVLEGEQQDGDADAHVGITIFFADREPAGNGARRAGASARSGGRVAAPFDDSRERFTGR
jgi:hypothetical protein